MQNQGCSPFQLTVGMSCEGYRQILPSKTRAVGSAENWPVISGLVPVVKFPLPFSKRTLSRKLVIARSVLSSYIFIPWPPPSTIYSSVRIPALSSSS